MKQLLLALALSTPLLCAIPQAQEITTVKKFNQLAAQDKPLVILFYAPWCDACKSMKKSFNEVSQELKTKATFAKINIETSALRPLAASLGITSIPTLIVKRAGDQSKAKLKRALEALL